MVRPTIAQRHSTPQLGARQTPAEGQLRCPKCGAPNGAASTRCSECTADLVRRCERCGATRAWYVSRCAACAGRSDDDDAFAGLFKSAPSRRLHGRFLLEERIHASRVGSVYRAVDERSSGAHVAVKELSAVALFRPDERRAAENQWVQAVAHWALVQHPSVARIVDSFTERDMYYVAFEYVPGWSLAQIIEQRLGRITPDQARSWGAQLCRVLEHLHSLPSRLFVPFMAPRHVMVTPQGDVKLVDLGLTYCFAPNDMGPQGSMRGYMAPELETGSPSAQSDVFALGRTLYAALVGRLLERGAGAGTPLRTAVPGIATQTVKAIARAAHRDPQQRFASAAEFGAALGDPGALPFEPVQPATTEQSLATPPSGARSTASRGDAPLTMADLGYVKNGRFAEQQATPVAAQPAVVGAPRLQVYPRQLDLLDLGPAEPKRVVIQVRNAGQTALVGRVYSHVSWIHAPSAALRLEPGRQARVIVSVRPATIPSGRTVEPQAISFDTNAGQQWIAVSVQVASGPLLAVEPRLLDWGEVSGEAEVTRTLTVQNKGRQPLAGSIVTHVPWVRVLRSELRCPPGKTCSITVQLLPDRLPRGPQSAPDGLLVDSDGGQERVELRAKLVKPELDLGAAYMDFGSVVGGEQAERLLFVGNTGEGTLEGSATSLAPWLSVRPAHILCQAGELLQLTVTMRTDELSDGPAAAPQALRIQTNGGSRTLPLKAVVRRSRLKVAASTLDYEAVPLGEVRDLPIVVANEGSAPLTADVRPLVEWLVASPSVVTCQPGERCEVRVHLDTGRFDRGLLVHEPAALAIVSEREQVQVAAHVEVIKPALLVEPRELDVGYIEPAQPETRTLWVANEGTGDLAWNAISEVPWLEVLPRQGVCKAQERQSVTVTAYGLGLETGVQSASTTLVVNSDGGRVKLQVRLALAAPRLACDSTFLDLGTSVNMRSVSGSFRVFNHGLGTLRGTITCDRTWLVADRASFVCEMGRSVEVRVSTDMDEYPAGAPYASGVARLESTGGVSEVEVAVNTLLAPSLQLGSATLILHRDSPEGIYQGRLVLRNAGMAPARIELSATDNRLELSRRVMDIKPGKSVRLAASLEVSASEPFPTDLRLKIDGDDLHLSVPVVASENDVAVGSCSPRGDAGAIVHTGEVPS